jgi:predicted outer membrane repeat protein
VGGSGALSFSGTLGAGAAGARVRACSFSNNGSFRGGAIAGQHTSGSLLIEDCDFSGNTAESGAALYVGAGGARTVLRGVDVRGNHSTYGGAIFQQGGDLVITQSVVAENTGGFGAGIYVANGDSFHLSHSTLAANHASPSQGGALALLDFNDSMEVRIDNCLVFANTAASIGGGMVLRDADDMRVTNCSFFLNEGTQGGGLYMEGHGIHEVRNCLFWENHASQSGAQLQVTAATTDLDYCNLQEGVNGIATSFGGTLVYGAHNSSVYPGFVDPDGADDDLSTWEDNDVRLGPNSDARDAGDNGAVPPDVLDLDGDGNTTEPVPLDLAGVARFVDSNESDTGNGSAPLVDLGCFEDQ